MARTGQIDLFTRRVRKPPSAPEFGLTVAVADTLRRWCVPGWRWTHIPLGEERAHRIVNGKDGKPRRVSFAGSRLQRMGVQPGWADFALLSPQGLPFFLELKRARGGKQSPEQKEFGEWCCAHNVPYAVARTYEDALARLQAWGAVRSNVRVSA